MARVSISHTFTAARWRARVYTVAERTNLRLKAPPYKISTNPFKGKDSSSKEHRNPCELSKSRSIWQWVDICKQVVEDDAETNSYEDIRDCGEGSDPFDGSDATQDGEEGE